MKPLIRSTREIRSKQQQHYFIRSLKSLIKTGYAGSPTAEKGSFSMTLISVKV